MQSSPFVAFIFMFQLISIIFLPYFMAYYNQKIDLKYFFKFLIYLALINILMSSLSRLFEFQLLFNNTVVLNKYGFLYQPYLYSVVLSVGLISCHFIKDMRYSILYILTMFAGLFFSDARAIAYSFILFYLLLLIQKSFINVLWAIGLLFVSGNFIIGKMSFSNLIYGFTGDFSLHMRVSNFLNYFEWATIGKFFFGGGFQSYYQFSQAYNQPGALDNLYLRLLAEIGLVGIALFLFLNYISIRNAFKIFIRTNGSNIKRSHITLQVILLIFCFSGIAFFHETQIVPRSGHAMYLLFVLLFFSMNYSPNNIKEKAYKSINENNSN